MKLQSVKLSAAVLFDGSQLTFIDLSKNRLEMDYDHKNQLLTISNANDTIQTPLTNVIYMKPVKTSV